VLRAALVDLAGSWARSDPSSDYLLRPFSLSELAIQFLPSNGEGGELPSVHPLSVGGRFFSRNYGNFQPELTRVSAEKAADNRVIHVRGATLHCASWCRRHAGGNSSIWGQHGAVPNPWFSGHNRHAKKWLGTEFEAVSVTLSAGAGCGIRPGAPLRVSPMTSIARRNHGRTTHRRA
jgi:hypothetical protein